MKRVGSLKNIRFAMEILGGTSTRLLFLYTILMLVQASFPLLTLYLTKLIFDALAPGASDLVVAGASTKIFLIIAGLGGIALLSSLLGNLSGLITEIQSEQITMKVMSKLHDQSIALDLSFYENSTYFDSMHRAQSETAFRLNRLIQQILRTAQQTLSFIAIIGFLFYLHWLIGLFLCLSVIPGVFIKLRNSEILFQLQKKRVSSERRTMYLNQLITSENFAKEIRTLKLGGYFKSLYTELKKQLFQERFKISKKRAIMDFVTTGGENIVMYGTFAFLAFRAMTGLLTVGGLVIYYQAFQRGQDLLKSLLTGITALYEDNLFLNHLLEFFMLKPAIVSPGKPIPFPDKILDGIQLRDVNFKYEQSEKNTLHNIHLDIKAGSTLAIVGENGSGKTTLIKLLARLYEPMQGKITLDHVELARYDLAILRSQIAIIFQDYVRFNFTVKENIWFGNIDLESPDGRIQKAAEESGADNFIQSLPKGMDTLLGKQFHSGQELSTGQWQKIALARTLMKDAQIIILDEPTSSLDALSEYHFFNELKEIASGKILILISHRLSTIKLADKIVLLENGEIKEEGTHSELMLLGKKYAKMYSIQEELFAD